ncbi:hypothetical protein TNCV_146041 [Trichonephila clavipes]|nr:hypothetical protein TNCV_146041 [Trichonephila clavipes]
MSVQRLLKFEEALELLNSLDSDDSDIEIAVIPDISELTDEERDDNEVNASEIIIKDAPGSLKIRSGDSFQPELLTNSSVWTTKSRKKLKDICHYG